jgi:hypothetical protein
MGTPGLLDSKLPSPSADLLANLGFAGGAFICWRGVRRLRKAAPRRGLCAALSRSAPLAVLLALAAFTVWQFLMLGVALMGLFYRLPIDKALRRVVLTAFLVAAFALGILLASGVDWQAGLVLGVAAYFAQVVIGMLLSWHQQPRDRLYLAFAQQNGITAISLSLLLETSFPGTVGIVVPAIITVNVLYLAFNASLNRWTDRRDTLILEQQKGAETREAVVCAFTSLRSVPHADAGRSQPNSWPDS